MKTKNHEEIIREIVPLMERRDYCKESIIKQCPQKDLTEDRPQKDQKWCLYDSKGERLLGRHPTKEKAEKQERFIQIIKHR